MVGIFVHISRAGELLLSEITQCLYAAFSMSSCSHTLGCWKAERFIIHTQMFPIVFQRTVLSFMLNLWNSCLVPPHLFLWFLIVIPAAIIVSSGPILHWCKPPLNTLRLLMLVQLSTGQSCKSIWPFFWRPETSNLEPFPSLSKPVLCTPVLVYIPYPNMPPSLALPPCATSLALICLHPQLWCRAQNGLCSSSRLRNWVGRR